MGRLSKMSMFNVIQRVLPLQETLCCSQSLRNVHLLKAGKSFLSSSFLWIPRPWENWCITKSCYMLWGEAGGNKSMGKPEKLKSRIPGLASYKPFPQQTMDFSSHTSQTSHPDLLILLCVPQLERSSGKKHQVPKATEHPCLPWAPTQHLLPWSGCGWSVRQGYTQEPPLCNSVVWLHTPLTAGNIPPKQLSRQRLLGLSWWAKWRNPRDGITQNS